MNKITVTIILIAISLTACTGFVDVLNLSTDVLETTSDIKNGTFDSYVVQHGVPTSSYKLSSGQTIYSFITPCPSSSLVEKTDVTVKENGYIQSISTKQSCPKN